MSFSVSDASAENYDKTNTPQRRAFIKLLSYVQVNAGFKCLDIGCGTGNNTAIIADKVDEHGYVLGIDHDDRRIEVAIRNHQNVVNLEFKVAKSVDIPICDGGYDLVVANAVMHWVKHDEKIETYRKTFDVLKPGGTLAVLESANIADVTDAILSFSPEDEHRSITDNLFFVNIEDNQQIFTSIGYEIIKLEEIAEEKVFPNLDVFFKWFDATLYGKVDSKTVYEVNENNIKIKINDDNTVTFHYTNNYMIVRKPEMF